MQNFKIGYLSNADLLARFGKLVQTERKITHLVLECIAEIDSRKLYLDKAYPSLYEFLVREFGYSPSAGRQNRSKDGKSSNGCIRKTRAFKEYRAYQSTTD